MKIAEYTIPTLSGERVVLNADFSKEVAKGIAVLDREKPGWEDRINVPELDLEDMNQCILGQLFMDQVSGEFGYLVGVSRLSGEYPSGEAGVDWATEHGFYTDLPHVNVELDELFNKHVTGSRVDWLYEQLALEWIAVIQARRAAKAMVEQIVPVDELVH